MGDISTWSPTDNSNSAAPPDGWPESMAPSAVNNSARAMMGAVRRWYDTVTAQLATFLPLSGGTLTGALNVPSLHSTGNVTTDATVVAGANVQATNAVTGASMSAAGTIAAGSNITAGNNITAGGTVTGTSFIGNVSVPSNGPVTTGGTVTGGTVTSTGAVNGVTFSASSDVTAAGSVTGGSMHCQGTLQVDGQSNLLGPLYVGPGGAWARIDSSGTYNVSGSWTIISDRAAKEDETPYRRGLEAIMALRPVAYRYRPEMFGAEEAERVRYGLVADDVAPVVPEMVGEATFGGRNLSTLNTGPLVFCLVNACRDLAAQNAALAARITALEAHS